MTEQRHGRYYAQELVLDPGANIREQLQEALDGGESQDWDLVGVSHLSAASEVGAAGGSHAGLSGVILFWDTTRPSFGRSSR